MPHIKIDPFTMASLPSTEDDAFEYKSRITPLHLLKDKINRAASAFANSGGGCFVAGVIGDGTADGGFVPTVGRQSLRDWVDQAIAFVSPPVQYKVLLAEDAESKGWLHPGNVMIIISFSPSETAPHMADDKKYYIRAGAHSVPASQFIVESLFARRGSSKPRLTHITREKPGHQDVIQIGVIALNSIPAVEVEFSLDPLPRNFCNVEKYFPVRLSVVDVNTPFYLDLTLMSAFNENIQDNCAVVLTYFDLAGNRYSYRSQRSLGESISPIQMGTDPVGLIVKAIEKLSRGNRLVDRANLKDAKSD